MLLVETSFQYVSRCHYSPREAYRATRMVTHHTPSDDVEAYFVEVRMYTPSDTSMGIAPVKFPKPPFSLCLCLWLGKPGSDIRSSGCVIVRVTTSNRQICLVAVCRAARPWSYLVSAIKLIWRGAPENKVGGSKATEVFFA